MSDLPELPEPRCVPPYTLLDMQAYAIAYAKQALEQVEADRDRLSAEVEAWRSRFPMYRYRPQDDVVALGGSAVEGNGTFTMWIRGET
jgi:hypothetical protein